MRSSIVWPTLLAALLVSGCGGADVKSLMASGNDHLAKGDANAASIQFKAALALEPKSPEARLQLGRALLALENPGAAETELRKSLADGGQQKVVVPVLARALLLQGQGGKVVDEFKGLTFDDAVAQADLKTSLAHGYLARREPQKAGALVDEVIKSRPDWFPARVLKARLALLESRTDDAISLLEAVVKETSREPDAHLLLGDIKYHLKKDRVAAVAEYTKVLALKPDHVLAHSALIQLYLADHDIDKAKKQVAQLKVAQPKNFTTRLHESQIAILDKEYAKARDMLNGLLKQAPDNPVVLHLAGLVEMNLRNHIQARNHFSKALLEQPSRTELRRLLATSYMNTGSPDKALETLKGEVLGDKPDVRLVMLAAEASVQLGEFSSARDLFQKASRLAPEDANPRASLALLNYSDGAQDVALRALEDLVSKDKGTAAVQALISLRVKERDFDGALKALDGLEAKGIDPALPSLLRGRIELMRGSKAAARTAFEAALAKSPTHVQSAALLAEMDVAAGQVDSARRRFDSILKVDPKNTAAMAELARVQIRTGADRVLIVNGLNAAIKQEPTDPQLRELLIGYLLAQRDVKGAMQAGQDALALQPGNYELLNHIGTAQKLAGDAQQALGTFRKLAQLRPKSADPYLRLAEVYGSINDERAALTNLQRGLSLAPENFQVRRLLARRLVANNKFAEALQLAKGGQVLLPKDAEGYLLEADIHMFGNKAPAASRALQVGFDATASPRLAARLYQTAQIGAPNKEAVTNLEAWLKRNPKRLDVLRVIADTDLQQHRYPLAERRYRELLNGKPDEAEVLNNLAWALLKQGKPDSVSTAERAVQLAPNAGANLETLVRALLAHKRADEAFVVAQRLLPLTDAEPALALSAAELLIDLGKPKLADVQLDKLVLIKNNPAIVSSANALRKRLHP